jgi:uncharacterized membrane protein
MAAIFAITSAFLYGLSNVITRIGLQYANILSAVLITLLSCVISSLILCFFFTSLNQFLNKAVLFFLAAGIIGPFWGRFFLYQGIDRVGTSIASPLSETKPLFSAIAAVLVLGEKLTSSIAFGVLLMMVGTATISGEQSGGQIEKKWSKKDLIFPARADYGGHGAKCRCASPHPPSCSHSEGSPKFPFKEQTSLAYSQPGRNLTRSGAMVPL